MSPAPGALEPIVTMAVLPPLWRIPLPPWPRSKAPFARSPCC
jgi:hypothetical protein